MRTHILILLFLMPQKALNLNPIWFMNLQKKNQNHPVIFQFKMTYMSTVDAQNKACVLMELIMRETKINSVNSVNKIS